MAARRRGRFSGRRKRADGHSFWLRPPSFNVTEREATTGTFSDLILAPSDFEDPNIALNDTKKGAPIVERLVVQLGFSQQYTLEYFNPAGFNQVTMHVEALLYMQSDQFAPLITTSAVFDDVLENQRILGYGVMPYSPTGNSSGSTRSGLAVHMSFEPKSKIRLREQAIGVAIRTNFDLGNASSLSNFTFVQATMLVRVP